MKVYQLNKISAVEPEKFSTGMDFLDELLGGGIVSGSTMIVAGTTGAGKSTALTQLAYCVAQGERRKVLYIAGEESKEQIKMRTERLMINSDLIFLTEKTRVEEIIEAINEVKPDLVIVDSLQMLNSNAVRTAVGTPSQMRYGLMTLTEIARIKGITIVFIGHATKSERIAGLQTFQHMVDVVLYLGINDDGTRILKTSKNRFAPTREFSPLYMTEYGIYDYPESKPIGSIKNITLNEKEIAEMTKGSFMRPFALMAVQYLKTKSDDKVLTPRKIEKLSDTKFGRLIVRPTIKWLEKNSIAVRS